MKNKWEFKPVPQDSTVNLLMEQIHLPKPLAVILAQRGVDDFSSAKTFFRPQLSMLHDPYLMKDMDRAVERIFQAIDKKENILVYGDYDVDGTTSVAMVYDFLKSFYPHVAYYVPDRYTEGYGISRQGVDFASDNDVSLVIALDCGIKALEQIRYAHSKTIDFIVCDHHLPGEELPAAVAVLDPKRRDCAYPYKDLSGCGVGFKLLQALADRLEWEEGKVYEYLDLVVVSIAADIVPMTGENRILSYYGLQKLKDSPRPGLESLLNVNQRTHPNISNIVFSIAPKINASGRLEHASKSIELLLETDAEKVKQFTSEIDEINSERKLTDGSITEKAIRLIREKKEEDRYSTVIYDSTWHKGVLGIVASRLTDTFYRPTLVLTDGKDGDITGSARSVSDFDIYAVIDRCADLLTRYGGHPFAAGLSMPKENLEEFKERFERLVKDRIRPIQRSPTLEIDTELNFSEITPSFLRILKQIRPFGPGNMTPLFYTSNLIGGELDKMGRDKKHLRLSLADPAVRKKFSAVAFGMGELLTDFKYRKFDVVYSIDENHWKGNCYLQLNIRDVRFKE